METKYFVMTPEKLYEKTTEWAEKNGFKISSELMEIPSCKSVLQMNIEPEANITIYEDLIGGGKMVLNELVPIGFVDYDYIMHCNRNARAIIIKPFLKPQTGPLRQQKEYEDIMTERYKSPMAVWLYLSRMDESGHSQILLQLRQNTGYMDDMYDLAASGHVEPGESMVDSMIREAKEEIGIGLDPQNVHFLTFIDGVKDGYHKAFFGANIYAGEPKIMEPDKCKELKWFDLDALPDNIIPYLRNVLRNIECEIPFDDDDFSHYRRLREQK